jgi:hypothetical protein
MLIASGGSLHSPNSQPSAVLMCLPLILVAALASQTRSYLDCMFNAKRINWPAVAHAESAQGTQTSMSF